MMAFAHILVSVAFLSLCGASSIQRFKRQANVPCTCVNFLECASENVVQGNELCPVQLEICCRTSEAGGGGEPERIAPENEVTSDGGVNGAGCRCVPFHRCDVNEGTLGTTDPLTTGGINLRTFVINREKRQVETCENFLDVCCNNPLNESSVVTDPPPSEPSQMVCGKRNPNGVLLRISGFRSRETQYGEFPWMGVVLERRTVGGKRANVFVAGSTLINNDVVITAAHHVFDKDIASLFIRLGEWDTSAGNEIYPHQDSDVARIAVHPDFGGLSNAHFDFALVFLSTPAQYNAVIAPICLPQPGQKFNDRLCTATGWGKNGFRGAYEQVMRKVDLPIVDDTTCQNALRTTDLTHSFNLHHSFLCAGGVEGNDVCTGDGGGPLACPAGTNPEQYILSGVISWGKECGMKDIPGVYAEVSGVIPWIEGEVSSPLYFV